MIKKDVYLRMFEEAPLIYKRILSLQIYKNWGNKCTELVIFIYKLSQFSSIGYKLHYLT